MEWFHYAVDLFVHLDKHLDTIITQYGTWTYLILFLVIFCETGLVVTPFLPGDSLLFAAGFFAKRGDLNPFFLFLILSIAAILGDTVNYWIGAYVGPRAFRSESRFFKREHLDRTHRFYEKYGSKTIVLARFVPIVRTFAPFVAGIGAMSYGRFIVYNVVGGAVWVALFVWLGWQLGTSTFVRDNFPVAVIAIVLISVMPMVIEYVRSRRAAK